MMSIRFQTFRKLLLGLFALISSACVILSIHLYPHFLRRSTFWMVVCIPGVAMFGSLWSAFRKSVFKSPQLVASEAIGLISLLPFQLILALVALAITTTSELDVVVPAFSVLRLLVLVNTGLCFIYALSLVITAMITVCAFDRDIWSRDIDSSPSPFPMFVLFAFVFPCLSRRPAPLFTPVLAHPTSELESSYCVPGCNCPTKPSIHPTEMPHGRSSSSHGAVLSREDNHNQDQNLGDSVSLSRSLVRMPNAVERRSSIVIAFEV